MQIVEGLALVRPPWPITAIHEKVSDICQVKQWRVPSYRSVYTIVRNLNPALLTLAHEGDVAFRDRYEFVHRHRAKRPNAIWQADHTLLKIKILDANQKAVQPFLTTVIDDYSRAVAGYMVFIGAPSALNTSLALRQAIWRKPDPSWPVCGIPEALHVDHGCDFTSIHIDQAASALRIRIIYSIIARPQGRGKVERLYRTINSGLLPKLPGYCRGNILASPPSLSLSQLDSEIRKFILEDYHTKTHPEIRLAPVAAWRGDGWIPRMPESLEALDLLLVMVAQSRKVRRDGIHFQGLRYTAPTLAAFVNEYVTIRYDPRDLGEIRVFHENKFLCRAVDAEHAAQSVSLKEIQAARNAYRRRLRNELKEKRERVADYLAVNEPISSPSKTLLEGPSRKRTILRTYIEDG